MCAYGAQVAFLVYPAFRATRAANGQAFRLKRTFSDLNGRRASLHFIKVLRLGNRFSDLTETTVVLVVVVVLMAQGVGHGIPFRLRCNKAGFCVEPVQGIARKRTQCFVIPRPQKLLQ
jgi:hypothetical protein